MSRMQKRLVGFETAVAGLAGLLAIVTIFWRDWLEMMFGWDPDHHNGTAELMIIGALAAVSVLLGSAARWQTVRWKRAVAVSG
jgi:hypothetical protein